jgi:pyridoxal 5'-phosphate synthase pdxS subunit
VFVGSGIFMKGGVTPLEVGSWTDDDAKADLCGRSDVGKLKNPDDRAEAEARAKAIVIATTHYNDAKVLADVSEQVPSAMKGLAVSAIAEKDLLQTRGW